MDIESKINDEHNRVPDNTIAIVTETNEYESLIPELIEPLKKNTKREWFNEHFYYCLPLLIGNQYGFVIKSAYDFTVEWDGGESLDSTEIRVSDEENPGKQIISSHFGSGIVTIQNRFHFRTPPGINLMTMNPPNYLLPNMQNLSAVIETDNLRRDFTFNIKVTTPNVPIIVTKGQPVSAILPIPRYFVDNFELKLASELFSQKTIQNERNQGIEFGRLRNGEDKTKPHGAGRLYYLGKDASENSFADHQIKIK